MADGGRRAIFRKLIKNLQNAADAATDVRVRRLGNTWHA